MKKNLCFLWLFLLSVSSIVSAQKTKIACIGNSITEGVGAPFHRAQAYPAALQAYLGIEEYEVMNFGVSGHALLRKSNAPYWGTDKYQEALASQPDIVIIKLGTNDSSPGNWTSYKNEFKSDYIDFVNSFKNLASHPKIYLCYPITMFPENSAQSAVLVNEIIPKIAEVAVATGSEIINLNDVFKGQKAEFYADDLHPNVMGARRMAYLIAQAIDPGFNKTENAINLLSYVLPFNRTDKLLETSSSISDLNISPLLDNKATTVLSTPFQNGMYFQVKLSSKQKMTSYTITADEVEGSPKSWTLQALVGDTWTTIHSQNNVAFQAKETKLFEIAFSSYATIQSASEYRLVITAKNGTTGNNLTIAEWQLFGSPAVFDDSVTSNGGVITDKYNLTGHQGAQFINDKIIDTKYCAVEKGYTYWFQYESPQPVSVKAYTLTAAEDVPDRDPNDWTLEASNDGVHWDILDKQICQYFMSRYSTLEYPVAADKQNVPYKYFKLNISRIRNWKTFQLAEWQLFGDVVPRIKVACIGASITEGGGVDNANDAYPSVLQRNLGNEYEVRNFGASGRYATKEPPVDAGWSYWTHPRYQASLDWEPDIVVIVLGTNDALNWNKVKNNFKADYLDLVRSYQELPSHPQVYAGLLLPITSSSAAGNVLIESIIPQIKEVAAEKNIPVIDLHTPFVGKDYLTVDGVHPNKKGYLYMAHLVTQALCPTCEHPPLPDDLFLLLGSFDQTDKSIVSTSSVAGLNIEAMIDNNPQTAVNTAYTAGNEVWFEVELPANTKITAYSLTSDAAADSPKSWELQGLNTSGNWVRIDAQNNVQFLSTETHVFNSFFTSYSGTANYKKYRLLIKANNGGSQIGLKEWQLFGSLTAIESSITSNGGTITEKLNKTDGQGAAQLIDRNLNTKYCTAHLSSGTPYWMQYESKTPAKLGRYTLTSAEDAPERDPVDWVLEGSVSGTNWVVLDEQTGQEFMGSYSTLEYPVQSAVEYKYFRLTVTKLKSGNMFQMSEWQLFQKEETAIPNIKGKTVTVYSNKGVVYIRSETTTLTKYAIYTISGQCMDVGFVTFGNKIIKPFLPGVYIVAIQTENNKEVVKVTIN